MQQWTGSLEERIDPMVGVAVAITAISTSAILVRWSQAPSVVKAFYRVLFMTIAVAPFALQDVDDLCTMSGRDFVFALISGLALAAHFVSFFLSLELTTVAASVTLITTQPIFVGIGAAVLLDEQLTPQMVGGMVIALVGAFCMSVGPLVVDPLLDGSNISTTLVTIFSRRSIQLYGNALALAGALLIAVYTLTGRSLRQRLSLFTYVFVVYTVCAISLGVLAVGTGTPLLGYAQTEWVLFLALAVLPGLVGHTVINWALKHVESSLVSVSFLGEPVGSTIFALVLLGEVPEAVTVLGGLVVLLGIYTTSRARGT
jgi:drug/metabolite transporter (DMT)-like permease